MKTNLAKASFKLLLLLWLYCQLHSNSDWSSRLQGHRQTLSYCFYQKNADHHRQKQIWEGENTQLKNQTEIKPPPLKTKTFCTRNRLKTERKLAFRNEKAYSLLMLNTTPAEMEAGFIFDSSINIKDKPKAFRKYGCSTKAHVMRDILLLILTWKTSCMTEPLFSGVTVLPGYSAY